MSHSAAANPLGPDVGDADDAGRARRSRGKGRHEGVGRRGRGLAGGLGAVVAGAARAGAGPWLLYLAVAVCVMWPYRSSRFRSAGDLNVVVGGIVEARNALAE